MFEYTTFLEDTQASDIAGATGKGTLNTQKETEHECRDDESTSDCKERLLKKAKAKKDAKAKKVKLANAGTVMEGTEALCDEARDILTALQRKARSRDLKAAIDEVLDLLDTASDC